MFVSADASPQTDVGQKTIYYNFCSITTTTTMRNLSLPAQARNHRLCMDAGLMPTTVELNIKQG